MTIRTIIDAHTHDVVTIGPDATAAEAIALLAEKRIGALPVVDAQGHVLGIFSERDVIYTLAAHGAGMLEQKVADVMTADVHTIEPERPALTALSLMTRRRVRHLPVVQGDALIGLVSIGDLVKYRIERIEAEAEAMRDYIQAV